MKKYKLQEWLLEAKDEMGKMWINDPKTYREYLKTADKNHKAWKKSVHNLAHHIWE